MVHNGAFLGCVSPWGNIKLFPNNFCEAHDSIIPYVYCDSSCDRICSLITTNMGEVGGNASLGSTDCLIPNS